MANSFELTGIVKHLFDEQAFPSGFSKREFVIEVQDGKYPQMVKFECVKDKVSILDGVGVGDEVQVTFDIRGNEFKERFYVNLVAWKLSKTGSGDSSDATARDSSHSDSSLEASLDNEPDESDDIPF